MRGHGKKGKKKRLWPDACAACGRIVTLTAQPAGPAAASKGHAYQACRIFALFVFFATLVFFALFALFAPSPAWRGRGSLRDPHRRLRRGRVLRRGELVFPGGGRGGAGPGGQRVRRRRRARRVIGQERLRGARRGGCRPGATAAKYVPAGQQLIYTAQLTVRAANVSSAASRATSIVSAAGGYVAGENASSGQGKPSQATATVTFKIPAAAYATTLAALSGGGLGTQLSLSQQAQDVTQQVADVGSRVTSDEAAIAQLRSLLQHAGDVSSLLSVQNQINSQESDLESMLAQQNALNHETAFATVTLTLVGPQAPAKPPAKATPPPGLAGGLAGGWHALRVTVSWLLTVLGAVAPFVAVVAAIGGLDLVGPPPA